MDQEQDFELDCRSVIRDACDLTHLRSRRTGLSSYKFLLIRSLSSHGDKPADEAKLGHATDADADAV